MNYPKITPPQLKESMGQYELLQKNTIILWCSRITFLFIFLSLVLLGFFWKQLPAEVPLWFSRPWGTDRLAQPYWLFLLPGASSVWHIINTIIALKVTKDHLVFSQILYLTSMVGSIFTFVTLSMIIWIIS